jgi:peptidoglycan/LPS O-acetylase OafA/YrhL
MNENKRIFGLDLLRAYAILCVVYDHGYFLIEFTSLVNVIPKNIYNFPVLDGVSIFFVLSGFLIGRILLRTVAKENFNGQMLIEFWVRRWFRTLPNYFLVLAFLVISSFLFADLPFEVHPLNLHRYFSFTQNLTSPHPKFFPEAWSLTVEEWFYLGIPIPLYFSTKLNNIDIRKILLFWIVTVIVFSTVFRFYRIYFIGYSEFNWDEDIRKQVITRLDSLMFGVLGAYASIYYKDLLNKVATPVFGIGIGLLLFDKFQWLFFNGMFYRNYFSLTITAVGTLLLLPKLGAWKANSGWLVNITTFVSLTSYSMYLLNYTPVQGVILPLVMKMVMHYLWRFEEYRVFIRYFFYWFITIASSYLLYRFFEMPMTALRDRRSSYGHPMVKAFADFGSQKTRTQVKSK